MKATTKLSIAFLIAAIALSTLTTTYGQTSAVDQAQAATQSTYTAIVKAYVAGADTNQLIKQLNQALNLTAQAQQLIQTNPSQAASLAGQAQTIAENVTQQANAAAQTAQNALPIIPLTAAVTSVAMGIIIFLVGPKALWKIWLKLRKNSKVKIGNPAKKNESFFLTAEQLCSIVLAITVIVASISVSGFLLPTSQGEKFSELGILGPDMTLGDYPSKIVASEIISLYGYVGNQMGTPVYYTVMLRLGNNETQVNPSNLTAIQEYRQVVPSNGTWIFPVNVKLTEAGLNQRLIFELWEYNQTTNQNQYHGGWGQVWLNVTAPVH